MVAKMCIRDRLHTVVRYVESDSGQHSLMLTFDPATLIENQSSEKKTILLLEDREEMVWLITGLFSEEYLIHSVKSVQVAFEEIHRSVPVLSLIHICHLYPLCRTGYDDRRYYMFQCSFGKMDGCS